MKSFYMTRAIAIVVLLSAAVLAAFIWFQGANRSAEGAQAESPMKTRSTARDGLHSPPARLDLSIETTTRGTSSPQRPASGSTGGHPLSRSPDSTLANGAVDAGAPAATQSDRSTTEHRHSRNAHLRQGSNTLNSGHFEALAADSPDAPIPIGSTASTAADGINGQPSVAIPAALQEAAAAQLPLSDIQHQAIDQTAGQFVEWIGGENQDPASPDYLERWQQSQPQADALLKARIGWQAYNGIQLSAAKLANPQAAAGGKP